MKRYSIYIISALVLLGGCQNPPKPTKAPTVTTPPTKPVEKNKTVTNPDGIVITPYDRPEIKREKLGVVVPNTTATKQNFDDGRQLSAYQALIKQTHDAFKQGKWDEAEKTAMHAQRLAPQSSESFMYLAMIANHKNQSKNAESLAKRGLSYAQSDSMKRQLWSIILKSAQQQKNNALITEAQTALKSF